MCEVSNISGARGDYKVGGQTRIRAMSTSVHWPAASAPTLPNDGRQSVQLRSRQGESGLSAARTRVPDALCRGAGSNRRRRRRQAQSELRLWRADPDDQGETFDLHVGAVIWATGWTPYDPNKLDMYSYGHSPRHHHQCRDGASAAHDGPTHGKIVRPSNGEPAKKVALIQCAGSRDLNHLPYCSRICCLGSLKHAAYVREQYADANVDIYYIDIRARQTGGLLQPGPLRPAGFLHQVKARPHPHRRRRPSGPARRAYDRTRDLRRTLRPRGAGDRHAADAVAGFRPTMRRRRRTNTASSSSNTRKPRASSRLASPRGLTTFDVGPIGYRGGLEGCAIVKYLADSAKRDAGPGRTVQTTVLNGQSQGETKRVREKTRRLSLQGLRHRRRDRRRRPGKNRQV